MAPSSVIITWPIGIPAARTPATARFTSACLKGVFLAMVITTLALDGRFYPVATFRHLKSSQKGPRPKADAVPCSRVQARVCTYLAREALRGSGRTTCGRTLAGPFSQYTHHAPAYPAADGGRTFGVLSLRISRDTNRRVGRVLFFLSLPVRIRTGDHARPNRPLLVERITNSSIF